MRVGIGVSNHPDPSRAVRSAARALRKKVGHCDLVLAFATPGYQPSELAGVLRERVEAPVCGASCGQLAWTDGNEDGVRALALIGLADVGPISCFQSLDEGAVASWLEGRGSGSVLLWAARPNVDVGEVARVLDRGGRSSSVFGMVAGDDGTGEGAFVVGPDGVDERGAVVAIVEGAGMEVGVAPVWMPAGPWHAVTRSDGALVLELDHRPAVSVLEEYIGVWRRDEPYAPVALEVSPRASGRGVLPIRRVGTGGFQAPVPIPGDARVRLALRDEERVTAEADSLARSLRARMGSDVGLVLSATDQQTLGTDPRQLDSIADVIGWQTPRLAVTGRGELCAAGPCAVRHEVLSMAVLS